MQLQMLSIFLESLLLVVAVVVECILFDLHFVSKKKGYFVLFLLGLFGIFLFVNRYFCESLLKESYCILPKYWFILPIEHFLSGLIIPIWLYLLIATKFNPFSFGAKEIRQFSIFIILFIEIFSKAWGYGNYAFKMFDYRFDVGIQVFCAFFGLFLASLILEYLVAHSLYEQPRK